MTTHYYRAQVTIPMVSGLPADSVVNVWSFRNNAALPDRDADALVINVALDGFYTALNTLYSSRCVMTSVNLKVYDMGDSQPRIPFYEQTVAYGATSSTNMDFPAEVALCLSFKGAAGSGLNAARRRGRVYLGPLQSTSTTDYDMVLASHITTVMAAANSYLTPVGADVDWCVYSPYTHHGVPVGADINDKVPGTDTPLYPEDPGNLDDSFIPVATYWMDNAWDTQRRRGPKATSRSSASV